TLFQRQFLEPLASLFMGFGQGLLDAVGFLAVGAALFGRHLANALEGQGHFPLLAEILRVPGAEAGFIGAAVQFLQRALFEGCEVAHRTSPRRAGGVNPPVWARRYRTWTGGVHTPRSPTPLISIWSSGQTPRVW